MAKSDRVRRGIIAFDYHFPKTDFKTHNAMLHFMGENPCDFFIFGGDQLDNQEVSPYTKGKPKLRVEAGTLKANDRAFADGVLLPIEERLAPECERVWIEGNHDDWRQQLVDENPELEGMQTFGNLGLKDRGWQYIARGAHYKLGKHLIVIHGDSLAGIGNQIPGSCAKKAVESYATNVVFGHFHSPQMHTKILPFDKNDKWQAVCAPILGHTNPAYLQNKPTSWLNGFVIVELLPNGRFNLYMVNVFNGEFSFGGKLYKG
jgi:predicted phosphodiesterase